MREFGVDRFRFAHALVRDTAYAALSRSRRARMHARVAEVLAGQPGRESEVARHWFAAGPQHAPQAWRAAVEAAKAARRVYAYDEAVDLLAGALTALEEDPTARTRTASTCSVELARSHLLTDNLVDLRTTVRRALAVADGLDDLDRAGRGGRAADHQGAVADRAPTARSTRSSSRTSAVLLDRLPPGDSEARCRVMIGLANEIYYTSSTPASGGAVRGGASRWPAGSVTTRVLLHILLAVPLGVWSPASADAALPLTGEAAELARELGDRRALATALPCRPARPRSPAASRRCTR